MALRSVFAGISAALIGCSSASACADTRSGAGDETHFQMCHVDRDCDGGYRCEAHTCRPGASSDRGVSQVTGGPICKLIDETSGDADAATVARILGAAATSCELRVSDYDRSCQQDSDCVVVGVGNACTVPCIPACPNTAINARDMDRYQADYDRTPLGTCKGIFCGCPNTGDVHCVRGACELLRPGSPLPMDAGTD